MPKPILYGMYLSPPVRSVLLVAKAIGLDLDFREVNVLSQENKKPEYLEKNPQHTVPLLDDDGKIIWDSHAIATYLIEKYGKDGSLYPADLYERAVINQRLHFDSGVLFVRLIAITRNIIFNNDPNIPQEKLDALNEAYSFLDKFLSKDQYLCGPTLTVADLCCISTISSSQGVLPVDSTKHPNLSAWMKRLEDLPYYEETNGKYAKQLITFIDNKIKELKK